MPDLLQIGESVQLTPEQLAQATPVSEPVDPFPVGSKISLGPEQAADARRQSGQLDPLQDFTAEQLAELQTQSPEFNLIQAYAPKTELQQRPGMHQKVADAYNLLRQKGAFGAQLDVSKVPGQLVDIAKGFGKQIWNYAQAFATPVGAMVADVAGADRATVEGMFKQGQRQVAENIAGTEAGLAGLGRTTSAGLNWINRRLKLSKPLAELSPEERVGNLQDALHSAKQLQEISRGKGPILSTVGDEVVKELETSGVPIRPEQVQELAAGDPFSWYLMGKAFHGLGAVVPASVSAQAAKATQAAGNFAAKFGGKTIETAADVTKMGIDAAAAVAPVAGAITGAVKGGTLHGPVGLATGAALGYKGGQVIAGGLTKAGKTAEKVSGIGEQIAGAKPVVSPVAQIGKDVLQSAPAAAGDLAKGVGFDLALAGLTSEEAPEERAGLGIGAAFGVLGAGKRVGGRVLSGQIIAPREYGVNQVTPSSGQFPALDAMHTAAVQGAGPGIAARLNAIRLFAKGAAPGTDVFLAKDAASMEAALAQVGMSPEQAKTYAAQQGFFTTSLPGRDGSTRKVIVAKDVGAAPHEAFHAIQDVLGENANLAIDKIVQDAYAPRWEAEGEIYARRLVGNEGLKSRTWREAILDASGWGRAEAADKIAMDAANRIRTATGAEPKADDVAAMARGEWASLLADAAKRNPGMPVEELQTSLWRDILNPQEAQEVGDRYLARELAAENFDAVFKHGVGGDVGVIPKLSRIVANVVSGLGGEPLAGRVSETGQVPLSYDVTQAVKSARPVVEPIQPQKAGPRPVIASTQGMPATPEAQQQAAAEARQIAAEAPAVAPTAAPAPVTPGAAPTAPFVSKSPRELLGQIAEAIAGRSGVKINYSSAPGEPAAALTSTRPIRRSIIEAFRTMPESARALWEKSFFPERVIKTKSGYQVLGWAPEVFAANAHKMAQTMIDLSVASPYELNPRTRSFSDKGWQNLFNDVTTFVKNQGAGRTGAGDPLIVPTAISEKGFFAPPTTGKGMPLDQRNADFINMLFHFKLPDTPRVTSGKLPLNIVGQEISAATQPGRVESPVQPKQPYGGEAAKKLGIEGREILEVNPVRREIEAAAAAKNLPMPSLIEAVQRLNLEHIKEVQVAPELEQFRGNTLTLTAGFQPSAEPKGVKQAAIRDENGKIYSGDSHAHATYQALQERRPSNKNQNAMDAVLRHKWATEGFVTNEGEFLNRQEAMRRAVELGQYVPTPIEAQRLADPTSRIVPGLESTSFAHQQRLADAGFARDASQPRFSDLRSQFSPAEGMEKLNDETFWAGLKTFAGKYGGGITGYAYEVGSSARTAEDLTVFRNAYDLYGTMGREAMKNKDYDKASGLLSKAQVAREAFEVATGQKIDGTPGDAGSMKQIAAKDPNYVPPLAKTPEPAQFQPPKFTEEEVNQIRGAKISYPERTYADASKTAFDRKGNPWVRRSATPENDSNPSNADRTLLVQITSDLMNPGGNINMDLSKEYYDKVYSGARTGYTRMDDFWEIPQWMGFASHIFPNADVYVVRSVPEAKQFLQDSQYKNVMFSALDVNKAFIKDIARGYGGKVDVGGWVDPKYFDDVPNVKWHNDLASAAKENGVEFKDGVDYRHFEGTGAIPRLNMSTGCKFQCAFCTVEKAVKVLPQDVIDQQADEIAKLGTELVYLGDKTFGQAPNYTHLEQLNESIRAKNPKFQGFVVQTTASQLPKLSEEWLSKSGIKFVELGIETFNDPILRAMQKPATEALMTKSTEALRKNGIALIPNIIIGLPGETSDTYARTLEFLKANADIISHANIYNLAVYGDSKLGKEITTASPGDFNENILEKSFHKDPEVHRQFAGDLYGLASSMLEKTPTPLKGQAQPEFEMEPRPTDLREATELWVGMPPQRDRLAIAGVTQTQRDQFVSEQRSEGFAPGPSPKEKDAKAEETVPTEETGLDISAQFAPKDKDYKLKPASSGFSKAWIFPDGTPVQIGGTWHNQWLDDNATVRKQYGFRTQPGKTDEDIRTEALQKGFARINYDARSGTLTVEAREKDWPEIAPAFEKIMQANLAQIDKVQVYQYNDKVTQIADSGFANLFTLPTKKQKLAAVPFLNAPGEVVELSPQATPGALSEQAAPGAMPRRGTQFQPLSAKDFDKEIEQIQAGKSFGQTFDPSGKVWSPQNKNVDIVSLASINVPQADLTPQVFRQALAPYEDLMKKMGVVAGAFSFSQDGKPMVSIDLNAVVPQKFRENTLEFAKANDQISIWDAYKGETVPAGGTGATKLIAPPDLLKAYGQLILGKPVAVNQTKEAAREQLFAGIGEPTKEPLSPRATSEMTKAQLADYYPEAVIAKKKGEYIPSDVIKSPLYKSAGSEDAAVDLFAQRLVDYAKENEAKPEFQLGKRWYRDFVPKLKKEFGPDAQIFVELLAATSPQTSPSVNFGYAYDALQGLKSGRFKKIIPKFEEGLKKIADGTWESWFAEEASAGKVEVPQTGAKPPTFLAHWIDTYNLKPRQSNGALYGIHSVPVLKVFARHWVDNNTGPKTRNFLSNLLGTGHDATIDVWADRTMRRLGYEGFDPRWRILPQNTAPVADKDFYFAQKAFKKAAEKLKLKPDDLQGGLWFAEKQKWADNGWGRLDLGSFQTEMTKIPAIKARIQKNLTVEPPLTTEQFPFTVEPRKLK